MSLTDRQPVPLTSDFVFKYVFGAKQSTEILRSLLSAVQEDAGYPAVATVQITNPFNQKDYSEDKLSVVDVKATDVTGATYTMEVQATWHAAFSSPACCPEAPGLGPLTDFIIHFIELPQFIHRDGIPHNSSSKNLTIGSLKVYPETGTIEK